FLFAVAAQASGADIDRYVSAKSGPPSVIEIREPDNYLARSNSEDSYQAEIDDELLEFDRSPARIYLSRNPDAHLETRFRMRAEFHRQEAILISGGELCRVAESVFLSIARAAEGRVPVVILVNDADELDSAMDVLGDSLTDEKHFAFVAHDTMWARDYGPTIVTSGDQCLVVDAAYDDAERMCDDLVPATIAAIARSQKRTTDLCLPGGNLLTNGRGICVTTTRVQEENAEMTQLQIADTIADTYGAHTVAFLEPLDGEGTGHVDMFATFTDEHTVVVGKYSHKIDPTNAAILDRNARRLSSIEVDGQKLRVVRIPMPRQKDDCWPTFTNVVFANGRLLVPLYQSATTKQQEIIRRIYSDLLPAWDIHFISADDLICNGGSLHCVVSNLGTVSLSDNLKRSKRLQAQPVERWRGRIVSVGSY
ncbi:MAG: agmatine deiminase family protein, partial [Planctomycetales bacterium]|nr:agmatine deiminase family protein [Planctomycetales bacterium]